MVSFRPPLRHRHAATVASTTLLLLAAALSLALLPSVVGDELAAEPAGLFSGPAVCFCGPWLLLPWFLR